MLLFRTQFPLHQKTSPEVFFQTVINWLSGSPHTKLADQLAEIKQIKPFIIQSDSEVLEHLLFETKNSFRIGFKYKKSDTKGEWLTKLVFNQAENIRKVSLDIEFEQKIPSPNSPEIRLPRILVDLLKTCGGGNDGEIKCQGEPIFLEDLDIDFAAQIINGKLSHFMPIVYFSAYHNGSIAANPGYFSEKLFGLAHVIVEPNIQFARRLKLSTSGANVYHGAVGVYWPQNRGREIFYRDFLEDDDIFLTRIRTVISDSLISCRLDHDVSMTYLEKEINAQKFKEISESGNQTLEELSESYNNDRLLNDQLLAEADAENLNLKNQILRLQAQLVQSPEGEVLKLGTEKELYSGETVDILLDFLQRESNSLENNSRRRHVIESLLNANEKVGRGDEIKNELKKIVSNWSGLDAKSRAGLNQLGFEILEDGKHLKVIFQNDERYFFTLSKTPSDSQRGGKNAYSELQKRIF